MIAAYDSLHRLQKLTESGRETSYDYDMNGNVVRKHLANGMEEVNSYDLRNRLTARKLYRTGQAEPAYQILYHYDEFDRLQVMEEKVDGTTVRGVMMGYDDASQLLWEHQMTPSSDEITQYEYNSQSNPDPSQP